MRRKIEEESGSLFSLWCMGRGVSPDLHFFHAHEKKNRATKQQTIHLSPLLVTFVFSSPLLLLVIYPIILYAVNRNNLQLGVFCKGPAGNSRHFKSEKRKTTPTKGVRKLQDEFFTCTLALDFY